MNLRLSKQHGLNPSVEQCFICMKEVGVVLFGKLKDDIKAPIKVCLGYNSEPCNECKKHMRMGIILISVDETKSEDMNNPWRTGGWVVIKEDALKRVLNPGELLDDILTRRMAFITDETWDMIGMPREEENSVQEEVKGG